MKRSKLVGYILVKGFVCIEKFLSNALLGIANSILLKCAYTRFKALKLRNYFTFSILILTLGVTFTKKFIPFHILHNQQVF